MRNALFNIGHISETINSINWRIGANERSQSNAIPLSKVEALLKATECELKVNYTVQLLKRGMFGRKGLKLPSRVLLNRM